MKPGWKTTEFWKSIATNIIGLLAVLGVFTPEQSSDLIQAVGELAGAIILAISTGSYAISRGMAKKEDDNKHKPADWQ